MIHSIAPLRAPGRGCFGVGLILCLTFISVLRSARAAPAGVVINEIMFDPRTVDGVDGAEYVELLNSDSTAISVGGWSIHDATGRERGRIPTTTPMLSPGGLIVVASDSTILRDFPELAGAPNLVVLGLSSLSLNNSGDDVVLFDESGSTIDSVAYDAHWHWSELTRTDGVSLERLSASASSCDARTWSSCVDRTGGTPGRQNSRSVPPSTTGARLGTSSETVSPDGDGFEDFMRISWTLPVTRARIVLDVLDPTGAQMVRIASNEPTAAHGELIWDGTDRHGLPLPFGPYVLRLEAFDSQGRGLMTATRVVVVARRL